MSSRRFVRLLLAALALLVGLGLTACSDDDGDGASDASLVPATDSYCDSVRAGFEIAKTAPFDQLSGEQVEQFGELWIRANRQAPAELRDDYHLIMRGDVYAADNINFYNESECGIDLRELPTSTTAP